MTQVHNAKRAAWVTDIHLNFLNPFERNNFYQAIKKEDVDCIFISGDIGEARTFKGTPATQGLLAEMSDATELPIYFVLGNHDYYFGRIEDVRQEMTLLEKHDSGLFYLGGNNAAYRLNDKTALFGVDGWADAKCGDYASSRLRMNDHVLIHDFLDASSTSKAAIAAKMYELALLDTTWLIDNMDYYLNEVMTGVEKVIILTHVPPFRESCKYERAATTDEALPFYCNQTLGERLKEFVAEFPEIDFTVLCGHTHDMAEHSAAENLTVLTGGSEYYKPSIARIIEF